MTIFLEKNMYLPTEMAEAISKFIVRLTSPPSLRAVHRYWPPSSTYKWIQMMGGVSKQDLYAHHNGAKLFMKKANLFWTCKYSFSFILPYPLRKLCFSKKNTSKQHQHLLCWIASIKAVKGLKKFLAAPFLALLILRRL